MDQQGSRVTPEQGGVVAQESLTLSMAGDERYIGIES